MDVQQWREFKDLIVGALELPSEERVAFLDQADLGANERQQVEAYLKAYADHPDFLEDGIEPGNSSLFVGTLGPGEIVDGYRIVRKIGDGGMGEVFEAEQLTPIRRRLALKLLHPGRQSRQALARFEAERQVLASMNHRNIAQVFGAGDLAGRPYLAMELVEGVTFIAYCDHHQLSIEARIALFVEVCRGVQHAHQRGIIHRDLKPSNILVCEQDGEPLPKVIDFGISKATADEGARHTEEGQWVGTPEYMSPEQAAGGVGVVDTRSDVYSLGVLLYELLTGCLPIDTAALRREGLDVLLRALREEQPAPPSRRCASVDHAAARGLSPQGLAARLAGDLDLVVLKALDKEADERYSSPLELAQDLLRHLNHQPLLAVEPSTVHVLRKLLLRHRLAFLAAAMIVLSLVVGVFGTSVGLLRARAAEQEAEARAQEARAEAERANREAATATRVTDFLGELFQASDPGNLNNQPGITTLRQVLDRGAQRVHQELGDEPEVQARLMNAIGKSYFSLGLIPPGQALLEESAALLEQTSGETPELAATLHHLAKIHIDLANYETSMDYLRRSLGIRQRLLGERHYEVSWVLHDMGVALAGQGKTAASLDMLGKALALKREVYSADHPSLARTLNSIGLRLLESHQLERAMPILEEALAISEKRLGPDHPELAPALNNLAMAQGDLGNFELAERLQERALTIDEKAFGSNHPNVAFSLMNLAMFSWEGRRDCALSLERVRRVEAILQRHYPPHHPKLEDTREFLVSLEEQCAGG